MNDEQFFSTSELLQYLLYLGAITYILATFLQIFIHYRNNQFSYLRLILLIIVSRLVSIVLTIVLWITWKFSFDIMFCCFLLPALFSELLITPVSLKIFGYKISLQKSKL